MSSFVFDTNFRLFNLVDNTTVMAKIMSVDTKGKGFVLSKPHFIHYDEDEDMIFFTDIFQGLSVSETFYLSSKQVMFSGSPDPLLIKMYRIHIGEIEQDDEDTVQDNHETSKNTKDTIH